MGALPCGAPERAQSSDAPTPSTNVGDLYHRQYELSEASRAVLAAARIGDRFLVEKHLGSLGKPNCCNNAGLTPMHAATQLGRSDIVQLLLKHDADVGAPPGPEFDGPPIALASYHGHLECIEVLLAYRAQPEATSNPYDSTCVHRAAAEGHSKCLRMLLAADVMTTKVAKLGGLHRTILEPHELIANFPDANERLPLHRAAGPGHCDCAEMLIVDGFSLLDQKDFNGNAALHMAVLTIEESHAAKIAQSILAARGEANLRDAQGRTSLHLVAAEGRAKVVAVLLQYTADVAAVETLRGRTSLHLAARAGARDVCVQLLDARADVKAGSRDAAGTAMMCAAPSCMEVLAVATQHAEKGTYYWRRDLLVT